MARKKSATLTEAELRLMEIIWSKKWATVREVKDALPAHLNLSYSTVLTTMRILENKGYVRHRKEGRAYVYCPVVERQTVQDKVLKMVMQRFFKDSPGLMMLNILQRENIDEDELDRLEKMIEDARSKSKE